MKQKFKLVLTDDQLKAMSAIFADIGQAFFASTLVPFVLGLDIANKRVLVSGLALSLVCWILSILVAKGNRHDHRRR